MLSFIRKRFPSKDRNNEHIQNIKSDYIQHENQDDNTMKKIESTNESNININENKKLKKNKKKKKNLLNENELISSSNNSSRINQINKSYSDVDYFPMMSSTTLSQSNRYQQIISTESNSIYDCYLNPMEPIRETNNNMKDSQIKTKIFEIPVIDCRHEQRNQNYKYLDHQRTQAIRQITQQRIKEKTN